MGTIKGVESTQFTAYTGQTPCTQYGFIESCGCRPRELIWPCRETYVYTSCLCTYVKSIDRPPLALRRPARHGRGLLARPAAERRCCSAWAA